MGFLLIQHELLRAKAKVNNLTLAQSRFKSKQDRIKTALQKKEEFFNKKKHALENKFNNTKSALTNAINGGNWAMVGGALQLPTEISDILCGLLSNASSKDRFTKVDGFEPNGDKYKYTGTDDTLREKFKEGITEAQYQQLQVDAYVAAQNQIASLKSYYQTMMTQFLESVKEAEENALEEEKDLAMLPLNEEDNDMEIKITTNEAQLASAKEYKQKLEEEMKERVKDSTPKFGLG